MNNELLNDPAWVARMEKYYDTIDKNKKGVITIDKVQSWATNLEKLCNPSANEMVKLRARLYKFWGKIGLKQEVFMTKEQFLEGVERLRADEASKCKNGYVTNLDKVNDAFFDIIDTNNNNILTLEELQYVMGAATKKIEDVDKFMNQADEDKNGVIARDEFLDSERKFWYKT